MEEERRRANKKKTIVLALMNEQAVAALDYYARAIKNLGGYSRLFFVAKGNDAVQVPCIVIPVVEGKEERRLNQVRRLATKFPDPHAVFWLLNTGEVLSGRKRDETNKRPHKAH